MKYLGIAKLEVMGEGTFPSFATFPVFAWFCSDFSRFDHKVGKEVESAQQYVLLPLWFTGSKDPQNTDADDAFDVKENKSEVHVSPSSSDKTKKHDKKAKREPKGKNMLALEDIVYSDDEEDVGVEAPQTRSMARIVKEQGGLNQINDEDFHTWSTAFPCVFRFRLDFSTMGDLVFEALDKRQIGEDAIISLRDWVYRLFPRDLVSKSTPSRLRIKQIIMVNLPPPNNDPNVPEGDQAPAAPGGFAPQWIDLEFDEEVMDDDDDDWDDDVEWLMAPVTPPRATVTVSSTYEVLGSEYRLGILEYRHGVLMRKMEEVSDAQVADSIAIGEIHPRVTTVEEQVQTLQMALHGAELQNQQLRTRVAEMESREGTMMSYMMWTKERLTVLEKRLPRPPPGP
nr:hypothetical protein [Tanacetum cinerariifolium]